MGFKVGDRVLTTKRLYPRGASRIDTGAPGIVIRVGHSAWKGEVYTVKFEIGRDTVFVEDVEEKDLYPR